MRSQTSETSSLVMKICGVLKDILIVMASMVVWHSPVTMLQVFGCSISLCGLVFYALPKSRIREHSSQANTVWSEKCVDRWTRNKVLIISGGILCLFQLFEGAAVGYSLKVVTQFDGSGLN